MAIAFVRKQNLVTNSRHLMSPTTPNYYHHNHTHNYQLIYNQLAKHEKVRHYSRYSNWFRRSNGKDVRLVETPVTGYWNSMGKVFPRIGLVSWYLGMINSRPLLTKSLTSSLIYVAADFTSQTIALPSSEPYDFIRTLRMGGYGFLVLGPTLHYWFNFVSKILPTRDLISTAKKMILGQTVYGPSMTLVFFSLNAALQGEDGKEIVARLKRDLFPTMLNGVMYWPLCDFITFKFAPVHLQPLVSNGFSYIWTVYMTYVASLEKASK